MSHPNSGASKRPIRMGDSDHMRSDEDTTPLRVTGFLVTALGGLLVGLGALREWAAVGIPGDTGHHLDVSVHGTDLWEGKVALAAGVLALIAVLAMRMFANRRRLLGFGIMLLGFAGALVAAEPWIRSGSRFGGADATERLARSLVPKLNRPFSLILAQIRAKLASYLRVDVKLGLYLTIAGGLLCIAGGALGVAWAKRTSSSAMHPPEEEPEAGSEFV